MSLHLYHESRMTPPINASLTNGHESDSDNASPNAVILDLEKELEKVRDELAKIKIEKRALSSLLQQTQDDSALLEQKYDQVVIALRKATNKINELETLGDNKVGEIAELKASLEAFAGSEGRLKGRLESFERECSRLCLEKSLLEEKVIQLEQDVKKLGENALNNQQLLDELELQRTANLELRRDLVAASEKSHRSLAGIVDDEDSPDRMIFGHFDQRTDGMNLRQELIMLGSPLTATCSRSVQFPSSEDIREGHVEDVAGNQRGLPVSHASVQTDRGLPKSFSAVSTQTTTSNLGNGTATALQPYYVTYDSRLNTYQDFPQPMITPRNRTFPPTSEANRTYSAFWWIWVLAVLGLIVAIMNNGGRIDITPIVDVCRNGLKFHYKKGIPPH